MNNDKINVDHRQNEKFQYVFELTEIEWCINFTPLDKKRRKEKREIEVEIIRVYKVV